MTTYVVTQGDFDALNKIATVSEAGTGLVDGVSYLAIDVAYSFTAQLPDAPNIPENPEMTQYQDQLTLNLSVEEVGLSVAPAAVWFVCDTVTGSSVQDSAQGNVYDPWRHEIIYSWDFGDAANSSPTVPLNMPDIWKDTNKAYGRRVAHVFHTSGAHIVTCHAYDPQTRRFGSKTVTITVEDANDHFSDGRTIVFAPDGTTGLTIPQNANVQATWAGADQARRAFGTGQTCRVLMAPGSEVVFGPGDPVISADNALNTRIGALDPDHANRPVLRAVGREGSGPSDVIYKDRGPHCIEAVFYGIDFQGEWDSTTETGRALRTFQIFSYQHNTDTKLCMMHRCTFDGFEAIRTATVPDPTTAYYTILSDSSVTNWQNYGIITGFNEGLYSHDAIVGSSLAQHVDALSGGTKNGLYNNHGPLRNFASLDLFVSASEVFTRNGWSPGGTLNGFNMPSEQPGIRINTRGIEGAASNFDRVTIEGRFELAEQNSTKIDVPGNHVFDKILQVAGPTVYLGALGVSRYGGATIRNYLGFKLNLPEATDPGNLKTTAILGFDNSDGNAANGPAGIAVLSSTGVDLRNDANARDIDIALINPGDTQFPVVTFENNLFYQPNRSLQDTTGTETVDLSPVVAGFSPRHKGPRFNFLHHESSLTSTVSGAGGTFEIPYGQLTDQIFNTIGLNTGVATDQGYWQTNATTDTKHKIIVDGQNYYAVDGDFTVSFEASGVTIANMSGTDWANGTVWRLQLDRTSRLPAFDPQYDSTGQSIAITIPKAETNGASIRTYDDFLGTERPVSGDQKGAFL